jgi:hypothetical protein
MSLFSRAGVSQPNYIRIDPATPGGHVGAGKLRVAGIFWETAPHDVVKLRDERFLCIPFAELNSQISLCNEHSTDQKR